MPRGAGDEYNRRGGLADGLGFRACLPAGEAAVSGRLFWNERIGIDSLDQMAERVAKSILD